MFDTIVGILSVIMVSILAVAIVDCYHKMWGSAKPRDNTHNRRADHSAEVEFVLNQSQTVAAERDRTIYAQALQIKDLQSAIDKLHGTRWEDAQETSRLQDTIRDHKEQIAERDETIDGLIAKIESTKESYRTKQSAIKESDAAYETLRIDYDQLHAAHKLLKNGVDMMIGELNAMTLQRDRLLEVIKLRDEKLDKLVARDNELISYIDGLKYSIKTRGGQVPDLNAAWHTKEKPVDVKQKYLLDDTPLDDNGSGVIDS